MGANLPAKKYSKSNPTTLRLQFEATGSSTEYIDIAQALSAINRKAYRQGLYYYVNSVEIYNNETGVVDLHTIPDNWITKNAWNRGFRHYQKMNAMVETPRSKWHDFKVFMSNRHRTSGTLAPVLSNINLAGTAITADEWAYSQFISADDDGDAIQNADNFAIHMLGPHVGAPNAWSSVSLIKSYQDTRTLPAANGTPQTFADGPTDPLMNLFDFSSEEQLNEIAETLASANDQPPYDKDQYIGVDEGHMQQVARIGTETGVGRVGRASGFCAPMGLLCVDPGPGITTTFRIVLNLAAGTYHGCYAERA